LYEPVSKEERSLVWYSREEEASFMTHELLLKGWSTGKQMIKMIPNTGDKLTAPNAKSSNENDIVSVIDRALLLGFMAIHGALLRAMLIGHQLTSQC
jgi:hypothetical protein